MGAQLVAYVAGVNSPNETLGMFTMQILVVMPDGSVQFFHTADLPKTATAVEINNAVADRARQGYAEYAAQTPVHFPNGPEPVELVNVVGGSV